MADMWHIVPGGQRQSTQLNPSGTGFTDVWVITYQVYAVFSFLGTIVNHVAAAWHAMYTWVNSLYTAVETFAHAVYAYLYKLVKVLLAQISAVTSWVLHSVFDPLIAQVKSLWTKLQQWGYTAYWYVTHPQDLADLLLHYLLVSLQKSVWAVARTMGEFFARLFLQNVPRTITLIEQIIADVL